MFDIHERAKSEETIEEINSLVFIKKPPYSYLLIDNGTGQTLEAEEPNTRTKDDDKSIDNDRERQRGGCGRYGKMASKREEVKV